MKKFTFAFFLISICAGTISASIVSNHNSKSQEDSATKAGSQRNLNPDYDYLRIKMRLPFELVIGEINHRHWIQSNKNLIQNMLSVPMSELVFPEFKREQLFG